LYAVKSCVIQDQKIFNQVAHEIKSMRKLSHNEHIITIEKVYFEDCKIYLVMQFAKDGSLFDYINSVPLISEKKAKNIIG
jgi:serine/threonine protein kinase